MAHHVNDFEPSPNLPPKDKDDLAKATAALVKGDIDKLAASHARDKDDLAKALGSLREDIAKMVTDEVAKQLKGAMAEASKNEPADRIPMPTR